MVDKSPCGQPLDNDGEDWRFYTGEVEGCFPIDRAVRYWQCGEYDATDGEISLCDECAMRLGFVW